MNIQQLRRQILTGRWGKVLGSSRHIANIHYVTLHRPLCYQESNLPTVGCTVIENVLKPTFPIGFPTGSIRRRNADVRIPTRAQEMKGIGT